jgi:palmitoyl-protein thioesterase
VNSLSFLILNQGVFGLPNCPTLTQRTCEYIRQVLNYAAYAGWLQRSLVQASYWHDPLNEDVYKQKSSFLADINNELKRNNKYIQRLQSLNKFVMIKFVNDTIVVPTETSHFGFYKSGSDKETITMEETELYIKDKLGLKKMKEEGKLEFKSIEGNHMQITSKYFIEEVVRPYLKDSNENESIQSSTQSTTETTETTTNVSNITNSTIPE